MNGKMGSVIQINSDHDLENASAFQQKMKKALSHCVGMRNSVTVKQGRQDSSTEIARTAALSTPYLYAITDDVLYRINKSDGAWYVLSSGWSGTSHMTISELDGYLYMIHFGTLYKTNPSNGSWTPLTTGWEGTKTMARNLHGVFAITGGKGGGTLVQVNSDGSKSRVGAREIWRDAKIMTGVTEGLSVVESTGLYFVSTASGSTGERVKVAGSGKTDPFWAGVTSTMAGTFLPLSEAHDAPIRECLLYKTTQTGISGILWQQNHIYPCCAIEPARWGYGVKDTQKMTAMVGTRRENPRVPHFYNYITYIIHDGTLIAFIPYETLGVEGDWANTTLLTSYMR